VMDNTVFAFNATQTTALAILREGHSGEDLPTTTLDYTIPPVGLGGLYQCPPGFTSCSIDIPSSLQPVPPLDAPPADIPIPLTIYFYPNAAEVVVAHFNNISYMTYKNTTILNLVRDDEEIPASANFFEISKGQVVDLIINNLDTGEHPLHLHGHQFFVLAIGAPLVGDFVAENTTLETVNPLRRDTASVNPQSWIYLRFVANNPGVWIFHCHINWHSVAGLITGFVESREEILDLFGPTEYLHKCPKIRGESDV